MKITTDFVGTEDTTVARTRLQTILDFYKGAGTYAALVASSGNNFWGQLRAEFNALLPAGNQINNEEVGGDGLTPGFVSDLNRINNLYESLPVFFGTDLLFWYNFSDVGNLWLDTARTSPITGAGQAIAGVTDRGGNGYHLAQSTLTSRPQTESVSGGIRALFDGVADTMSSVIPVDFGGADAITVSAALNKGSDASSTRTIVTNGNTAATAGTFGLFGPRVSGEPGYAWHSRGTVRAETSVTSGYPAPHKGVITGIGDISDDIARLRVGGVQVSSVATDQGTGSFATRTLWVGSREGATWFFDGSIANLIGLRRVATTADLDFINGIHARAQP